MGSAFSSARLAGSSPPPPWRTRSGRVRPSSTTSPPGCQGTSLSLVWQKSWELELGVVVQQVLEAEVLRVPCAAQSVQKPVLHLNMRSTPGARPLYPLHHHHPYLYLT